MTDTRPGEISRIALNEVEFRVQALTGIAEIKAEMRTWNRMHEEQDERQFSEVNRRIDALYGNVVTVTSEVNKGERKFAKLDGMKLAIIAFWTAIAAGITWFITSMKLPK